jgi:hypothetical protein
MPIVSQWAPHFSAANIDDHYSATYTFEQLPINEFATVQMTALSINSDNSYGNVAFRRIRIRQSNGYDRTEYFPDIDDAVHVTSFERRDVTSITIGISGARSICEAICNLLDWVD